MITHWLFSLIPVSFLMIELKHLTTFPQLVIALDEVGRSPLSGPVVIGALKIVINNPEELKSLGRYLRRKGVKDSKLLNADKRAQVISDLNIPDAGFREIGKFALKQHQLEYVIWEMDHETIDRENILAASLRGMKEAALSLAGDHKAEALLLIDGQLKLRWEEGTCPWKEVSIVKGDAKSVLIGLAAILAKQKRDGFMQTMHTLYPHYNFASNVGYPTPEHRRAIALHGPCPIHRKSFAKVKEFLVDAVANESE